MVGRQEVEEERHTPARDLGRLGPTEDLLNADREERRLVFSILNRDPAAARYLDALGRFAIERLFLAP